MENRCLGNHKSSQKWAARQAADCPLRFTSGMGLPKQTHVLRSDFVGKERLLAPYEGLRFAPTMT